MTKRNVKKMIEVTTRKWPSLKDVRELQCGDEVCFHYAWHKVTSAYEVNKSVVIMVRIVRGSVVMFLDKELSPLLRSMRTRRKVASK